MQKILTTLLLLSLAGQVISDSCLLSTNSSCSGSLQRNPVTSSSVSSQLSGLYTQTFGPSYSWSNNFSFSADSLSVSFSYVVVDPAYDSSKRAEILGINNQVVSGICNSGNGTVAVEVLFSAYCFPSPSPSPSRTPSPSPTNSPIPTSSSSPSFQPSKSASPTPSNSPSLSPSRTPSPSMVSASPTISRSQSPPPTSSSTPSPVSPTPTRSPSRTPSPSKSPSPSQVTKSPSPTPSKSKSPSRTPSPSQVTKSPSPTPSRTPSSTPSGTPSPVSPSPTRSASSTPTASPSSSVSPSLSPSVSRSPLASPTRSVSPTTTPSPSLSPSPTQTPSSSPTPSTSSSPSQTPLVYGTCLQDFSGRYTVSGTFQTTGNETLLFSKILESFRELVPLDVSLFVYGRNFRETEKNVVFAFAVYFNDSDVRETISNRVFVVSFNALSDVFPSNDSESAILSTVFSNNYCSTDGGGGGLTPGQTAGIVVGAVIGAVVGVAALLGMVALGMLAVRLMNKAPAPEQLATQDKVFSETAATDNAMFSDPVQSVQNELYTL
ncbi:hypothetical protein A9K97_gp186 [Tokyovirus A1]|uniref:hypothetical protein n=1 Tax=Tokyovirus A1 TaxID=1826170 RepID=UPI0007A97A06|nr:hypothetical protein A9K97_gp186 [Tokyovirus A1]BAU80165.1 hypothetical protein [Tokyovirus A1]